MAEYDRVATQIEVDFIGWFLIEIQVFDWLQVSLYVPHENSGSDRNFLLIYIDKYI